MSTPEAQINQIAIKVGAIEADQKANTRAIGELSSSINRLVDKLEKSDDIAKEADQRAKSAHHRIDDANKRIDDIKVGQRWLIGITITLSGLFVSAAVLVLKLAGQ